MTTIIEKVEWNMADELNKELARLRKEINMAFMIQDYSKAFEALTAMKMTASHVLNNKEHSEMTAIESKISPLVYKYYRRTSFNRNDLKKAAEVAIPLKHYLLSMNRLLMSYLDKYGFLGGRRKDASKMLFGSGYKPMDENE